MTRWWLEEFLQLQQWRLWTLGIGFALLSCTSSTATSHSTSHGGRNAQRAEPTQQEEASVQNDPGPQPCGEAPSHYEHLAKGAAQSELATCVKRVESKLTPAQVAYLKEVDRQFPMGFGLEETVTSECFSPAHEAQRHFESVGICSTRAAAMLVLRCIRSADGCNFPRLVEAYYRSEEDAEWRAVEADGLPPGVFVDRHGQRIPKDFEPIVRFLEYLASHVDLGPYDPKRTLPMEADEVAPHLSPGLIQFSDVNWKQPIKATRKQTLGELESARGKTFRALTELGWIYGVGGPQNSLLRFTKTDEAVRVTLPEHYELTFQRRDETYVLTALHQLLRYDR